MSTRLQKKMAVDAAWLLGVLAVGGFALGGTIKKLHDQRSAVDAQRSALGLKETRLTDEISARERLSDLTIAKERLERADAMVADESRRISLISQIAEASSMRIVSVKSGASRPTADKAVLARRHELIAVGDFRDVATFIDALQSAEGSVAIDAVKIGPAKMAAAAPQRGRSRRISAAPAEPDPKEPEADDHHLRISLEVIWLGASDDFDAIREKEKS